MRIYGTIKDAVREKPIPNAKINLLVGDKELAVLYSDNKGQFEHKETGSYPGETLTCEVEKKRFKPQKATYKIEHEELPLEIELIRTPHCWEKITRKCLLIFLGIPAGIIAVGFLITWLLNQPRIISFTADPPGINEGGSSTLTWETKKANKVYLNDKEAELSGSQDAFPTETTTYRLIAKNFWGTKKKTCEVNVEVEDGLPRIKLFTANPGTINRGQSSTLSWETENAQGVYLNNQESIRQVLLSGEEVVSPQKTTEYQLIAMNDKGKITKECMINVVDNVKGPRIVFFKATPQYIKNGISSTLSWRTENANAVYLNNRRVNLQGSERVSPSEDTPYNLSAKNSSGSVASRVTVYVIVIRNFEATPSTINIGETAVLSWEFVNAPNGEITPQVGRVGPESTRQVQPTQTTVYTLTVERDGQKVQRECTVTVDLVDNDIDKWQFQSFSSTADALRFLNDISQNQPPIERVKICAIKNNEGTKIHVFYQQKGQPALNAQWRLIKYINTRDVNSFFYNTGDFKHIVKYAQIGSVRIPNGSEKIIFYKPQADLPPVRYRWYCNRGLLTPEGVVEFLNTDKNENQPLRAAKICAVWRSIALEFRVYYPPTRLNTREDKWIVKKFSSPGDVTNLLDRLGDYEKKVKYAEICAVWRNGTTEYMVFYREQGDPQP